MYKITLDEKDTPKKWYNIAADLPVEFPEYSQTEEGKQLENLPKIFSKGVLQQELSTERYIEIPKEIRNVYKQIGRPSPLFTPFARRALVYTEYCAGSSCRCNL